MARKIGVQLYTVREALKRDFKGVIQQVAKIGYSGVELAGDMGGMQPKELRSFLDDLGLSVIGGHIGFETVSSDKWGAALESYAVLGAKFLGLGGVGPDLRNAAGVARMVAGINAGAAVAATHGIAFTYHNHNFEFETAIGAGIMYDTLVAETDPTTVKFEVDSYWVKYAGQDPVAWIDKLAGRAALIHIKDMTRDDKRTYEIIGDGQMDFDAILAAGDRNNAAWFIVEQDLCPKGELESITRSFENMRLRGWL
jgi:sugar phosphate isomerase/epimerase